MVYNDDSKLLFINFDLSNSLSDYVGLMSAQMQESTGCPYIWCQKRQRQLAPEEVLGTPEGVAVFAKWAPVTGFLHRRYRVLDTFAKGKKTVYRSKVAAICPQPGPCWRKTNLSLSLSLFE